MALFRKKEPVNCDACGKDAGRYKYLRFRAKDGIVCQDCYNAAGFPSSISISLIPVSLIIEQIDNDDSLSIAKRFKQQSGVEPEIKLTPSVSDPIKCPSCNSTQISIDKKGFGVGKAVIGAAVAGPIGLAAGNIGAKKIRITCLKCGKQWMAGT